LAPLTLRPERRGGVKPVRCSPQFNVPVDPLLGDLEMHKRIELSLPPAEALHVLKLLDAHHALRGDPLSKSAAKKVWRHLVDAGLLKEDGTWTKK
jgi:hypothetical protein